MLLLDEPLSALDPFLRIKMREELKRLQRELGITFIHVTHSQDEAMALADLMVVMDEGEIRQAGRRARCSSGRPTRSSRASSAATTCCRATRGLIAVRADRCRLGVCLGSGPVVSGRVAAVEYQGAMVRVALATDAGEEASALLPDGDFYARPVEPGDAGDAGMVGARRACPGGGLRADKRGNLPLAIAPDASPARGSAHPYSLKDPVECRHRADRKVLVSSLGRVG